jgi:hypothetical protein
MAALTPLHYRSGNCITTSNATAGSTGDTLTLTGAGVGKCQRIHDIAVYGAGTVTAIILTVTKNDGTTVIAKWGATGAAATPTFTNFTFTSPIICAENDNAIVTITMTGATASTVHAAVNYEIATT